MSRYAVVPSQGCYGSGERVSAVEIYDDRDEAIAAARAATAEYQEGLSPHGGSSGGYRVIETDYESTEDASWLGHDLDRKVSVQRGQA